MLAAKMAELPIENLQKLLEMSARRHFRI